MTGTIRENLDTLGLSDIYTLMLFILYKMTELPEYATLSELCYIIDSRSLTRMLARFAGKTIKVPTSEEFRTLTNALLMYQSINIEGQSYADAVAGLTGLTKKQKDQVAELYLKIIPIVSEYNINRSGVVRNAR